MQPTDKRTNRHTHTQNNYRNPLVHVCWVLMIVLVADGTYPDVYEYIAPSLQDSGGEGGQTKLPIGVQGLLRVFFSNPKSL